MNTEKEISQGISIEKSGFLKWLDNYWFHYKWPTIGIAFALIVVLICTIQSCSKEKEDITILYAGTYQMVAEDFNVVNNILDNTLPKDYDGNGKKSVVINRFQIYSKEQIEKITAETDAYGVHGFVDTNYNSSQYDAYSTYILTGESSVLLLDPWLYEALRDNGNGVLMKLEDVFDELPEKTVDGYGIRLGDTELYREYAGLRVLPADTVICLMRPIMGGKSYKEKNYIIEKEMFAALTGVKVKE